MKTVEVSAKTREEAIQKALDQLGVERYDAHVEIIDEGSRGFLGIGARDVVLRVSADVEDTGAGRGQSSADEPRRGESSRPARRQRGGRGPREPKAQPAERREGGARREPAARREERTPREERPKPENRPDSKLFTPDKETEERGNMAAALLHTLISKTGIESNVKPVFTENGLRLSVQSEDSAILIGRKGLNLQAMQYLLNRMISSDDESEGAPRVVIDIEGYRDRRYARLEEMALQLAAKAKQTRRRIRVKPLTAEERRIVHLTLENDPDVRTFSVGASAVRSVIIAPKDELPEPERDRDRDRDRRTSRPPRGRGRRGPRPGQQARRNGDEPRNERDDAFTREETAPSEAQST